MYLLHGAEACGSVQSDKHVWFSYCKMEPDELMHLDIFGTLHLTCYSLGLAKSCPCILRRHSTVITQQSTGHFPYCSQKGVAPWKGQANVWWWRWQLFPTLRLVSSALTPPSRLSFTPSAWQGGPRLRVLQVRIWIQSPCQLFPLLSFMASQNVCRCWHSRKVHSSISL